MPPSPARPKNPDRQRSERAGRWAETLAALYLQAKLYRIVARRYKTPVGEIDLIARRFGHTIFVEVKARTGRHGEMDALLAVNRPRILRAAQYFLARNPRLNAAPMRFDVIFLAPRQMPRHVMNAFSA